MTTKELDPLIHNPERLRVVAILAALPRGDALSVARLQDMIGLTPGSLIIRLHELGHAGYVRADRTRGGRAQTTITLTRSGWDALDRYTAVLRQLPEGASQNHQASAPGTRAGDADRDAVAAALSEHFTHGRLTLDEFITRLDATLTATTHGELSQVTRDLPDLTVPPAPVSSSRRKRASRGHKRG
jgi:DNA-binding MarR family transcriptional regulator